MIPTSRPLNRSFPLGARIMGRLAPFCMTWPDSALGPIGSFERLRKRRFLSGGRESGALEADRFKDLSRSGDALSEGGRDGGRAAGRDSADGTASRDGLARVCLGLRAFLLVGGGSSFVGKGWPKTF